VSSASEQSFPLKRPEDQPQGSFFLMLHRAICAFGKCQTSLSSDLSLSTKTLPIAYGTLARYNMYDMHKAMIFSRSIAGIAP
jgi:hypothetical protein